MDREEMRAWIREHRVCWELSPRYELHDHRRIPVGFDLSLFARHPDTFADSPGCEDCRRHHDVLREIVHAVLAEGPDRPRYEFAPFDGAVHLRPETGFTLEIELDVAILHRGSTFAEADARDRRTATEIQEALRGLGVQPRMWRAVENLNAGR
jgi:hypothetical protein